MTDAARPGRLARLASRWLPPVLFLGVVYRVSMEPTVPAISIWGADKVLHAAEYAVFGLLLSRATGWPPMGRRAIGLVLIGLAAGFVDEWIQSHTPGRMSTVGDWIADGVGVTLGVITGARWGRRPSMRGLARSG